MSDAADPTEQATARALAALAGDAPPAPPPLSAALEAELAQLAPTAPRRPLRQLAIALAASAPYAAVLLAVLTVRRDLHEIPMWWLAGAAAAWLAGIVVPLYLALVPRAGTMTPRWRWAAGAAVAAAIGFVVLGFQTPSGGPSSLHYGWEHVLRGQGCLWIGLGTALVPVALGAIFLRGALPVCSRWVAAALGAGGGCLGGLVLHFHCNIADPMHVGLVHGSVVVVAAALAAWLVPRATNRSFR